MSANPSVLQFECEGERLVGIVDAPSAPRDTAVLIVVGGPQYRAGSHRQFVSLARTLAAAGFPTLRFDVRGMGDSTGAWRSFEQLTPDIGSAIDALLHALPSVRQVVLWGLCDGASACLLYLHERPDARVRGLALVNPWVRSAVTQATTRVKHYYLDRLKDRSFWSKLIRGQVGLGSLFDLARSLIVVAASGQNRKAPSLATPPYQQRMAMAWAAFEGPILLLMSEHDYTAREFDDALRAEPVWQSALTRRPADRVDLLGADHTCSEPQAQAALEATTVDWLQRRARDVHGSPPSP